MIASTSGNSDPARINFRMSSTDSLEKRPVSIFATSCARDCIADFLGDSAEGSFLRLHLARRRSSLGPPDGPHLPALPSPAEELIAAIGLEPRHAYSGRHIEFLQNL